MKTGSSKSKGTFSPSRYPLSKDPLERRKKTFLSFCKAVGVSRGHALEMWTSASPSIEECSEYDRLVEALTYEGHLTSASEELVRSASFSVPDTRDPFYSGVIDRPFSLFGSPRSVPLRKRFEVLLNSYRKNDYSGVSIMVRPEPLSQDVCIVVGDRESLLDALSSSFFYAPDGYAAPLPFTVLYTSEDGGGIFLSHPLSIFCIDSQ